MLTVLVFFVFILICWLCFKRLTLQFNHWRRKCVNYERTFFLLTAEQLTQPYDKFSHDRYFGVYQVCSPILVLRDPQLIATIGVKEIETFTDHLTFAPEDVDPLWSKGLFQSTGQRWRELRPLISPCFTGNKMRIMFNLMNKCAQQMLNFLNEKNEDTIDVDLKDIFTRYTNDVVATTAFGLEVDSVKYPNNTFYTTGKKLTNFSPLRFMINFLFPLLASLFKIRLFPKDCADYFTGIIRETINTREEKGIFRPDFLQLLMELRKGSLDDDGGRVDDSVSKASRGLTMDELMAQAFIFFLAGFETSSSLMSFALYELAVNPDVQSKLRDEIQRTRKTCSDEITYDVLLGMKYLDLVLMETLRKWPPNTVTDRVANRPYVIQPERPGESPLEIRKGDMVWIPIYQLHHDPRYFPNPETFDPERFSDENKAKIPSNTYIPFGIGPRTCIGSRFALLETKLLVYYILSEFEVVPTKESRIPIVLSKRFNLTSKYGFRFAFKKSNNS